MHSLTTGQPVGFFWGTDPEYPDNPRPDAWCWECDQKLSSTGGEWNDQSEGFAKITLLCGGCYDRAKELWTEAQRKSDGS